MTLIGSSRCNLTYDYTDVSGMEEIKFDIYVDNNIIIFKNANRPKKNIAVIDEKHIDYKLYKRYNKEHRASEISRIYLENSVLHIEGFIPYVYFLRYWLGYGLKIEILDTKIINSILQLNLPSSL